jgi:hypothetical protein
MLWKTHQRGYPSVLYLLLADLGDNVLDNSTAEAFSGYCVSSDIDRRAKIPTMQCNS